MGGKSQTSTGQSTVSIPPEVLSRYNAVNAQAQTVAQTPFQQYSADPNAFVAGLTPTQEAGVVGTNQYSSEAQPFYNTASAMTLAGSGAANPTQLDQGAINQYENPYLNDVIAPTSALMNQEFNQAQSGQEGNAIQQGAFGGDRAAVTAANLGQQNSLAYGNTIAPLLSNAYNTALSTAQQQQGVNLSAQQQNLARLTAGGAQEANIGAGAQSAGLAGAQAQLTAGQAQQQTEQAGLTALYNQFLQQQSYPFQTAQFLANIAEGTGALSGSSTASTSTSPAPFFSDERLKEDIEPIGETYDGTNIVKFRYKGSPHKQIGLIAQDVERKHPEAVGLAGGYKTVDYDAATKKAASQGGLAHGSARRAYAYGGMSPNAAWDAGFYVDPSYLNSQEEAYANAPWSNVGPVNGNTPGKGRNIPTGSGVHGALAVAPPPRPPQQPENGLQQLSQGLGAIEHLGQSGKNLFKEGQAFFGNSSPSSPVATGPAQAPPPPDASSNGSAGGIGYPALGLGIGYPAMDNSSLGSDFTAGAGDLGFGDKRGGLVGYKRRTSGGMTTPSYNQPTDADTDDSGAGGDVPYDSGTGMQGFDIPDYRNNNKLAVAPSPQSSQGSGSGFNPMGLVGPLLGIFGLARGGLAGGGDGPDDDDSAQLNAAASIPTDAVPSGGVAPAPSAGRDITVHARPQPASDAPAPVPPEASGLSPKEAPRFEHANAQVAPMPDGSGQMNNTPVGLGGVPDMINNNQGWLVPLLHGLGTMASSNSRYLGSAVLQGLGGAADSYENTQNQLQNRALNVPVLQERQQSAFADLQNRWMEFNAKNGTNIPFNAFVELMKKTGSSTALQGQNYSDMPREAPTPTMVPQSSPTGDASGNAPGISHLPSPQSYRYSLQEMQNGIGPDGIPLRFNPAYLQTFSQRNGAFPGYLGSQARIAEGRAAQINGQGFTYDARGNQVLLPGQANLAQQKGVIGTNVAMNTSFLDEARSFNQNYANAQHLLTDLQETFSTFRSGSLAEQRAALNGLAKEVDPSGRLASFIYPDAKGSYDDAMKTVAASVANQLAQTAQRAPAAEMNMFQRFAGSPELDASALRQLIVRGHAALQYQHDLYNGYDPTQPGNNPVRYTNNFNSSHNYEKDYIAQTGKTVPLFAGQTPESAPLDQRARHAGAIYRTPDGKDHIWMADHWESP